MIAIKDMEMPNDCRVCPFTERIPPGRTRCLLTCRMLAENYNAPLPERNEYCPLVDIKGVMGAKERKGEMMTDTEMARRKAICEAANVDDIGEVSDGFHTFNSLYEQRMILFAALVKAYKTKAWKSYRHENGEYCFDGGWFVVGIDTPEGNYTYHYENQYWDMFDCIDLPRAPHWDGHTEADAETRLMSLEPERKTDGDTISRQQTIDALMQEFKRIPTNSIRAKLVVENLPSAQPEYEPVTAEDFAKTMSDNTLYGFMAWHGEALELMERHGFVICKKTM